MSSIDLRGQVALVTGGGRGIGRAVAECLAGAGVNIIINYLRDESAARETVARLKTNYSVGAFAIKADISCVEGGELVVNTALEKFGRVDLLICNAGVWEGAAIEEMSEEIWDRTMAVNLKGAWTLCRAVVPWMKRQKRGKIVIVSSTAGQRGEALYSNYAASKGGQIAFVKSLAVELAAFGVSVNGVAPGWVETEMTAEALQEPQRRREIEESIPLGRIATPADIAWPVLFLCSEWARHITGEILNVNGGSVLCS